MISSRRRHHPQYLGCPKKKGWSSRNIILGFPYLTLAVLGHASVTFTYDRYGHLMPEADAQAAGAVAALVYGAGR